MAKFAPDAILDKSLDYIAANATTLLLCSSQPTDRAGALTAALADVTVDSGDFSKADGDSSGRKLTVAAQNGVTIDTSGTATHVALIDGSALLFVTTCASTALAAAGTVNIGSWKIEIADPV